MSNVKNRRRLIACGIAVLIAGIVIGRVARVRAEDMGDKKAETAAAKAGEGMSPDMAEMMALAKPGPQHEKLAKYAGDFTAAVTMWMDPKQDPMKSTGKLHQDMFADKYLMGKYEGSMMNMPFHGMSCTGYDNGKKKWFNAWIDDMGSGLMVAQGDADAAGKTITLVSDEQYCPQTKGMIKFKEVNTFVDDDNWKMEMYGPGPDGKEMKMMEILYTRVKG